MKRFHSLVSSFSISISCSLLLQQHPSIISNADASSASSPTTANQQRETVQSTLEATRYSSLPPTVFAPGGRLYGVERVAKEALLLEDGVGDEDVSSCGVLALHCGCRRDNHNEGVEDDDDDDGEFAVMVGIGPISPFLHRDEGYLNNDLSPMTDDGGARYLPLTIDERTSMDSSQTSTIQTPLSILSPTLIVGAGGKAIDSTILLRRSIEVALSMYSNDNGGVDLFVHHSLEGITKLTQKGDDYGVDHGSTVMGGAAGVDVTSLARRVADMAQTSTQSMGGRHGRMLSSSLLAVGARNPSSNNPPDNDTLVLWRVDPTGQLWRLDASAVGRGAMNIESELLRRAREWTTEQSRTERKQHDRDESEREDILSNRDVRAFLGSLSVEEAVEVATGCLVDGISTRGRKRQLANNSDEKEVTIERLERGLKRRVQAVVIRSSAFGQTKPRIEVV